ncbi:hypothetical protein L861_03470 [Litchfieldella anticariensis FP35 = DSM 16096]|uniref:Uncharacterized protein n=1 Tax=Litchfieldella anticariensis (strain DSM 16096 / CECT 5854 / CIP 108499 / LMG 22089 / FP35) TaxID=1121939 RepID=S2L9A2_LITA3|nr:hypothetical protein [Halomonas anticariensis]EPC04394.1 hypothetical protein L861_03470 [Halomonas anticariensis FP35 = DSM 16096]
MAERPEEERHTPRIVPDADASIAAHRYRYSSSPRVWPLWCLIVLLGLALGGLGYLAWQERQGMLEEIRRLEGQLSNVHARFDAFGDNRTGAVDSLEGQVESLIDDHRSLRQRVEEQERLLDSVRETGIDDSELEPLQQRLNELGEAIDSQKALIAAIRTSLDALERAGEDGRAFLATRLSGFESAQQHHSERLDNMAETLGTLREARDTLRRGQRELEERVDDLPVTDPERLQGLEQELASLTRAVETLEEQRDTDREALEAIRGRLSSSQAQLTELRQNQVALSASLEALRSQ